MQLEIKSTDEEGEPDELLVLSHGQACEEVLHELRLNCEEAMKEKDQWPSR